jgi:cation diffusion facilitator CzcD-associated flavoprotein CzcO
MSHAVSKQLPVAVIGAGPIGLAAAAHLLAQGEEPLILEAGPAVGATVREWSHVRFFSPWRYSIDDVAAALLEEHGWQRPDPETFPTGGDLVARYLEPLAALPQLASRVRFISRVAGVTRQGYDKLKTAGRDSAPFVLHVRSTTGQEDQILARAVIDASGTWTSPNPLGASGLPAAGEREHADHMRYGIPDVLGAERLRYAGKTTLVAGRGASAFNTMIDLAKLAREEPDTQVLWTIRSNVHGNTFGGGEADQLPERGALGQWVRRLVESGVVRVYERAGITRLERDGDRITVHAGAHLLNGVDEIVVTAGFRPDLSFLSEMRLGLDPALEAPTALAPLIDPNVHSCGTVRPHGAAELAHPEPDFYIAGMKSYGRAPTFLLMTGYEQVRSIAAALAGDWEAARDVRLVLSETGVCSSSLSRESDAPCCAPSLDTQTPVSLLTGEAAETAVAGVKERSSHRELVTASSGCCGG